MIGPLDSFVWGSGGAQLTPTQIDAQRKVAQALMAQGSDYSPVQSWTQGASRVAQAIFGGMQARDANEAAKTNAASEASILSSVMPGGSASTTATPSFSTPMGQSSIPAGKDEFVSSVMPMAEQASLKTGVDPRLIVAQAAVESGYGQHAPGNNLFGIKSHGQPGGNSLSTTEVINGQPVRTTDSFRSYASPADSVSGYADFINSNPRYASLKNATGLDAQVAALGRSGYATDPDYAAKVGSIARSLPLSAPQVVDANAPSPLDGAAYPAGPIGAPGTQLAQNDPAAIPVNAQPTQGFAIPGQTQAPAAPTVNPGLAKAMTSPYISAGTKQVLGMMLHQQMEAAQKAADPLHQIQIQEGQAKLEALPLQRRGMELANQKIERELQGEGATPLTPEERVSFGIPQGQSAYKTRRGEIKFGPAGTNITTNVGAEAPDGQLRKKLDEGTAKNWTAWQEAGHVSAGQVQDLQMLDELVKVAPQGPITGRLAEAFPGVSSAGDAFNAIVKRVAPTMRAPGSGSTSDIEYDGMLRSLPALRNKPEANVAISEMMKAKSAVNIERADIISQYSQNQISRNDAEKRLGEINHRSIMTPAMRKMLGGLGGKGDVPLAGDIVDNHRFKGGNPADKSSWEPL